METIKNKTIYNEKLIKYSKKYLVYSGNIKDFKQYIYNQNIPISSGVTHFIIYYDSSNRIVHVENIVSVPKIQKENKLQLNLYKWILQHKENKYRLKVGVSSKFEQIINNLPLKIFDNDENIKIMCLEISHDDHSYRRIVKKLKEELEDFLYVDTMKYEHYIKENIGSFFGMKLFFVLYLSIIIATVIKINTIIPFTLINDTEIVLIIKLVIGVLLAIFSIFIIMVLLAIIIDAKAGIYSKYNLLFGVKMFGIGFALTYSILCILFSIYKKDTTQHLLLHNFAYNLYIDNKTSLVYDSHLKKTIVYLGSKDGVYYYYDSFDREKLNNKLHELNISKNDYNPTLLKKIILNIDIKDKNTYFHNPVKIENTKNLDFDYNESLIMKELL